MTNRKKQMLELIDKKLSRFHTQDLKRVRDYVAKLEEENNNFIREDEELRNKEHNEGFL